ncbi:MAG TPA: T9SS type A sorting domain-containing protein [Mariniflexile sp.]|nr:T9SS type A sorting domain-containing protein [Mariniflexile sp.]
MVESDLVLGTKNFALVDNNVSVYPNPSKDIVYIKNDSYNNLNIDILDITGALIKSVRINSGQNRIDVSDLQSGIY